MKDFDKYCWHTEIAPIETLKIDPETGDETVIVTIYCANCGEILS